STLPLPAVRWLRWTLAIVALLALPSTAGAHPVPFSYVDVSIGAQTIGVSIVAHIFDLGHDLGVEPADRLLLPDVVQAKAGDLTRLVAGRFAIDADGRRVDCEPAAGPGIVAERQSIRFRFTCAAAHPGVVSLTTTMFPYDPQHQTFLNV